jgi:hypothetical protein
LSRPVPTTNSMLEETLKIFEVDIYLFLTAPQVFYPEK